MKKLKYIISLLLCISFGYVLSIYTYPRFTNPKPADSKIEPLLNKKETVVEQDENEKRQYIVDIPAKYFDHYKTFEYGDTTVLLGVDVILPPVAINEPVESIKTIDEFFSTEVKGKFQQDLGPDKILTDVNNDGINEMNFKYMDPIDVDNDGIKEKIVFVSTSMNHSGGEILVVKKDRIIFKSGSGANKGIAESKSNNGFYISEAINAGTLFGVGGGRTTRYIYDQGKFIPVWYREFFDLQTTNFTKASE